PRARRRDGGSSPRVARCANLRPCGSGSRTHGVAICSGESCTHIRSRAIELHRHRPAGDRAMSELAELTPAEVAAANRSRKDSSVEVTSSLLARIAAWQPTLNAFVRLEGDEPLASAAAADAALARGDSMGVLHGVPLAHKDMYYVAGKLAECGSKLRKGF